MKFRRLTAFLFCSVLTLGCFAQLPSVQLKNIDGKTVNTASLSNDGKPFVISFFATWCKPCNRELKAIHEVYPEWQDETGMKLIAISIDEAQNAQKVKPMVDSEGWEYEVLLDPNSDFFHALGGQQIPFVLIIDGDGKIAHQHSGYIDGSESKIIEFIRGIAK
jgi:peroxiredoxin